jgi:uncharacterized membrane protein YeaQ/YmgE (transglycosylase-associated protein family)
MEPVGWVVSIFVGGVLGWLADWFARGELQRGMTIVMGVTGAIVTNAVLDTVVVQFGGLLGYLVGALVGACILIGATRALAREV